MTEPVPPPKREQEPPPQKRVLQLANAPETDAGRARLRKLMRVFIQVLALALALLLLRVAAVRWRAVGDARPTRDSAIRQEIQRWTREDLSDPNAIVISCGNIRREMFGSGSWLEVVIDESSKPPGMLSRYRIDFDSSGKITGARQLAVH